MYVRTVPVCVVGEPSNHTCASGGAGAAVKAAGVTAAGMAAAVAATVAATTVMLCEGRDGGKGEQRRRQRRRTHGPNSPVKHDLPPQSGMFTKRRRVPVADRLET